MIPNEYRFKDIVIGLEESFESSITELMVQKFLEITGDINPLHNDSLYAIGKGYNDRVVYGMLTASLMSTLAGVYLPGRYSLIHNIHAEFPQPVYVGDILKVNGKVIEINEPFMYFVMRVTITNQSGKKVLRGKMQVGVNQ